MNIVILSGNLCKNIVLTKTENGMSVIRNSIAVKRERKINEGESTCDFVNITIFDKNADYLSKYGKKGDRVELMGHWQNNNFTGKDGKMIYGNLCIVERINLIKTKSEQNTENVAVNDTSIDDDIDLTADLSENDLPF